MPPRFGESTARTIRTIGALSAVGFAFVLAIVMGFWIGHTLDGWLGTSPWLSLVFFFLGLAAGVLNVFRTVRAVSRDSNEQ
jgi:ATP synthase protein I